MRWAAFLRLRVGSRVLWKPTCELGRVAQVDGREVWVKWASGRIDKLNVEEDAAWLFEDTRKPNRIVSDAEIMRRVTNQNLRNRDPEDTPENLARVWSEAARIRAERECDWHDVKGPSLAKLAEGPRKKKRMPTESELELAEVDE